MEDKKVDNQKVAVKKTSDRRSTERSDKERSEKVKEKVLRTIMLRNRFFFILYRYSTLVFLTSLASFLFSIVFLIFFAKQPIPPQYIAVNPDGTLIKMDSLDVEKPSSEVQKFALDAIKKMYKFDYVNFSEQVQDASSHFTQEGWNEYLDQYVKSGTLTAIKENKWIVTVKPATIPIIVKKGLVDGVFVWEVQTNLEIMYVGQAGQIQHGEMYMRITRDSVINNPEGLGIVKAVFKPTT